MHNLSIVTPCSRPQNLVRIRESVPEESQWIIVLDRPNLDDAPPELLAQPGIEFSHVTGVGIDGNAQRNLGARLARRDYVYFLDDDNVVHPRLPWVLSNHAHTGKILVVHQLRPNGRLRLQARPPVRVGTIDTAQVLLPRRYTEQYQWRPDARHADGVYFTEIYRNHEGEFVFLNVKAAHYNYLRPDAPDPLWPTPVR